MGAPVRVGDLLADKYEVTKVLGQGGMGVVVAARHRELDKLVALKFMHEEVAADEAATDRFLREARAAARLQSEHVGKVLDVGRMQNGVPYIVMEFLEGRDLSDVAADAGGALPVAEVCEYMLQTCEAMAEAHIAGIIHRDLKPQNLFLAMRPDGRPLIKVLDFGISKIQSSTGPTSTQQTMGTPAYMSPEQMRSAKSCDGRADIWSLGVISYQLLSGTLPFVGDTIAETMIKVISDELPPLAQARPGLPPALVAAVEKCLRKKREERFDNVAELAHELTPFAPERARAAMSLIERVMSAGASQSAPRAGRDDLSSVVPSPATVVPRAVAPQTTLGGAASQLSLGVPKKASPAKWIAASIVFAAAVVITVFAMQGGGSGPISSSAPEAGLATPPDAAVVGSDSAVAAPPEPIAGSGSGSADVVEDKGSGPGSAVSASRSDKPVRPSRPPRAGSGSARASRPGVGSDAGSGTAPVKAGSEMPAGGSNAGSGSSTPKERKPVGEDPKPRKPVGN